jgi:hypothetical protein
MHRVVCCFFSVGTGCRHAGGAMCAAFLGVPKRLQNSQTAIHGEGSHFELGCGGGPSFFFLQANVTMRRIFINLAKGSTASVAPSGMFPGGGAGSRALRSCGSCGGEDQGFDCVFSLIFRVFHVKVIALSCISLLLRDCDVNLYPPLDQ